MTTEARQKVAGDPTVDARIHDVRGPRTDRRDGLTAPPSLGWQRRAGQGIAVLNPLSYGVTNQGVVDAPGQFAFLDAMGSGFDLITYDQRGSGEFRVHDDSFKSGLDISGQGGFLVSRLVQPR